MRLGAARPRSPAMLPVVTARPKRPRPLGKTGEIAEWAAELGIVLPSSTRLDRRSSTPANRLCVCYAPSRRVNAISVATIGW